MEYMIKLKLNIDVDYKIEDDAIERFLNGLFKENHIDVEIIELKGE